MALLKWAAFHTGPARSSCLLGLAGFGYCICWWQCPGEVPVMVCKGGWGEHPKVKEGLSLDPTLVRA